MIDDETDTPSPSVEALSQVPSTDAPSVDLDLEAFLQEYDQAVGTKQEGPLLPQTAPERDHAAELRGMMQGNRDVLELQLRVRDLQEERLAQRENADREEPFAQAQTYLEGLDHLPEDFARRWLIAEANLDPELHHAWHSRYEDGDALRRCTAALRRSFNKMRAEASRMSDPDATADRAAVVDAMTRGRASGQFEKPAPDLSRMSDNELRDYTEKSYGFSNV